MRLLPAFAALAFALPAQANSHWPTPNDILTATPDGLLHETEDGVPRDPIPFGTGFQDVMHVVVAIHGHEVSVGFPAECGAGPMVSADIPGAITLMFQDDQFVGWMLIGDDLLLTRDGLWVGAPRSNLPAAGEVSTFESGIGTEFQAGNYFGLFSEGGDHIQAVWSGTNCIFR